MQRSLQESEQKSIFSRKSRMLGYRGRCNSVVENNNSVPSFSFFFFYRYEVVKRNATDPGTTPISGKPGDEHLGPLPEISDEDKHQFADILHRASEKQLRHLLYLSCYCTWILLPKGGGGGTQQS